MPFWNSETLRKRLPEMIAPYDGSHVETGSYELGMGTEAYVTGEKTKQLLGEDDQVIIPPGQFAQLITEERVRVPPEAMALISIKSKFKFWGLINVSGFHVDPGFDGKLIFSVYNAGVQDIVITRGTRVFLIWFATMDHPSNEIYAGKHALQEHIPDEEMMKIRGNIPSLASLEKKIDGLDHKVTVFQTVSGLLIGLAISILMKLLIYDPLQTKAPNAQAEQKASQPAAPSSTPPPSTPVALKTP